MKIAIVHMFLVYTGIETYLYRAVKWCYIMWPRHRTSETFLQDICNKINMAIASSIGEVQRWRSIVNFWCKMLEQISNWSSPLNCRILDLFWFVCVGYLILRLVRQLYHETKYIRNSNNSKLPANAHRKPLNSGTRGEWLAWRQSRVTIVCEP